MNNGSDVSVECLKVRRVSKQSSAFAFNEDGMLSRHVMSYLGLSCLRGWTKKRRWKGTKRFQKNMRNGADTIQKQSKGSYRMKTREGL